VIQILRWLKKSIKNKFFITLVSFCIIPLIAFGFVTNLIVRNFLHNRLNVSINQSIETLSLYIARDLQGFIDLPLYCSQNTKVIAPLKSEPTNTNDLQSNYDAIKGIFDSDAVQKQVHYPFYHILVSKNGEIYTNFAYYPAGGIKDLENSAWYKELKQSFSQKILVFTQRSFLPTPKSKQIYVASNIQDELGNNEGILVLNFDASLISHLLENVRVTKSSSLFIVDSQKNSLVEADDNIISYNLLPKGFISGIINNSSVPDNISIQGKTQAVFLKKLPLENVDNSFWVVMITPIQDIEKDAYDIDFTLIVLILVVFFAILVLTLIMSKDILNPIIQLSKLTTEVQKGNLNVRVPENRVDELGVLGHTFNDMLDNLKKHLLYIKANEEDKRILEVKMLQSQINPHFVRNTLNIILWMAEMKKATGISKVVTSFMRLIDYNFNSMDVMVPVRDEISMLEDYIYLQKLRYQNKFFFNIIVDDDLMECKVLKLTFQPIVENSIVHGFADLKKQGILEIKATKSGEKLLFTIQDNGVGMDSETLKKIMTVGEESISGGLSGIGIANVAERIRLNFGEAYGLKIISVPDEGTKVEIILPILLDTTEERDKDEDTDSR
jgi:two-component system sensor histidine kinase YesM